MQSKRLKNATSKQTLNNLNKLSTTTRINNICIINITDTGMPLYPLICMEIREYVKENYGRP
jgi:hypothetical protein